MNPKFKVVMVVEVGEECESIADHIKALRGYLKEGAFGEVDVVVIGEPEVEEFHG